MSVSKILEQAQHYEQEFAVGIEEKPLFHVSAPVGWLNDPNGFSRFEGNYHLFYQYHPYTTQWGPMHWGHVKTQDFIQWTYLPCALAPDTDYDKDGCFSGTAMEHDGKHILMYTGVSDNLQTQCIAVGDGVNYEKSSLNPVINLNAIDFRDPKIWRDGDIFRTLTAHRSEDGSGELLEYRSTDLIHWDFFGIFDRSSNALGKMWECPDILELDGERILVLSTQEMKAKGREFHPGNCNLYLLYDKNNIRISQPKTIDYGLDFYAPQTTRTDDGRTVMIAWAQNWDNYLTPGDFKYSGIMTIPRELSLDEGKLIQTPVRELSNYLKESPNQNKGRIFDLRLEAKTDDWFSIRLASDGKHYVEIFYDYIRGTLTVDRTNSGNQKDTLHTRTINIAKRRSELDLRIIMDKYIMEVFVNGGEQALTTLLYAPLDCDAISYHGNKFSYTAVKYDICF